MKNVKSRESFVSSINEMAKAWPVGTVVKFNARFDEPADNRRISKKEYGRWSQWSPSQPSGVSGGSMYMEITESGKMWLSGKILYVNCSGVVETGTVRMHTMYAAQPTNEFKIFQKNEDEISKWMGKTFYLEGDEDGILTVAGESKKVEEGEYIVKSMNFKLTDLYEEPVFFVMPKSGGNVSNGFSVKISSIDTFQETLTAEQREVINDWFTKQLGSEIELSGERFRIRTYRVTANSDSSKGFPKNYVSQPYFSLKDAEDAIKALKTNKVSFFDPSTLKAEMTSTYDSINLSLDEMVKFCRSNGIEVSVKQLMQLKRGAVTGKKYGL